MERSTQFNPLTGSVRVDTQGQVSRTKSSGRGPEQEGPTPGFVRNDSRLSVSWGLGFRSEALGNLGWDPILTNQSLNLRVG